MRSISAHGLIPHAGDPDAGENALSASQLARRVREHGHHASMIGALLADAEFGEDVAGVLLDDGRADAERVGDAGVGAALGHELEHLALAGREEIELRVAAAAAKHP